MRRPTRRQAAIGGGSLATLTALAAAGVATARNRYATGTSPVVQIHDATDGGFVVVLTDKVFWAPDEQGELVKSYAGSTTRPLPYRIDRYRPRHSSGLLVGAVDTKR